MPPPARVSSVWAGQQQQCVGWTAAAAVLAGCDGWGLPAGRAGWTLRVVTPQWDTIESSFFESSVRTSSARNATVSSRSSVCMVSSLSSSERIDCRQRFTSVDGWPFLASLR